MPVLIAAVVVLLLCALELGRFGVEWWRRLRNRHFDLGELVAQAIAEPSHAAHYARFARQPDRRARRVGDRGAPAAERGTATEHALVDYELAVQRSLDRTRLLVRAGPAIGLMGTLIPLIPGWRRSPAATSRPSPTTSATPSARPWSASWSGPSPSPSPWPGPASTPKTSRASSRWRRAPEPSRPSGGGAMSRIGLGRHRTIDDDAGDPLDGLVNLFDVGMILAIAFLIAGLGLTLNLKSDKFEARQGTRPAKRAPQRTPGTKR